MEDWTASVSSFTTVSLLASWIHLAFFLAVLWLWDLLCSMGLERKFYGLPPRWILHLHKLFSESHSDSQVVWKTHAWVTASLTTGVLNCSLAQTPPHHFFPNWNHVHLLYEQSIAFVWAATYLRISLQQSLWWILHKGMCVCVCVLLFRKETQKTERKPEEKDQPTHLAFYIVYIYLKM